MPAIIPAKDQRGRTYLWDVMVRLSKDGGFTITDLNGATRGTSLVTIKGYMAFLRKVGAIEKIGSRPTVKNREVFIYRVAVYAAPEQRASGSTFRLLHQQIWTALRAVKGSASARDIALLASTDDVPVPEASARAYLMKLARAGIAHSDRSAKTYLYRLLPAGNMGPRAPIVCRRGVFNPNNGDLVTPTDERRAA